MPKERLSKKPSSFVLTDEIKEGLTEVGARLEESKSALVRRYLREGLERDTAPRVRRIPKKRPRA